MPTIYMDDKKELPARSALDYYRTEQTLIDEILPVEMGYGSFDILDPGCGDGRWGRTAFKESGYASTELMTVDVDPKWNPYGQPALEKLYQGIEGDHIEGNFADPDQIMQIDRQFDYVVGNPPYGPAVRSVKKVQAIFDTHGWGVVPEGMSSLTTAEIFIRQSWDLLRPHGKIIFLLESQFASSMDRYYGLFRTHAPIRQWVCSRRPSFYGRGTNATEFSIFVWKKDETGANVGSSRAWPVQLFMYEREKLGA